jgi:hypothetical protein
VIRIEHNAMQPQATQLSLMGSESTSISSDIILLESPNN